MAVSRLQLDKELTPAEAQRDVLKTVNASTLVGIRYDPVTGIARVETRAFPAFPTPEPESDESKLINGLSEQLQALIGGVTRDRELLEIRESQVLRKETLSDERAKAIDVRAETLAKQVAQFEKDVSTAARAGLLVRLRSFFHTRK